MSKKTYIGKRVQTKELFETPAIEWHYIVTHQSGLNDGFPEEVPMVHLLAVGRHPGYIERYITIPTETFEKEWTVVD